MTSTLARRHAAVLLVVLGSAVVTTSTLLMTRPSVQKPMPLQVKSAIMKGSPEPMKADRYARGIVRREYLDGCPSLGANGPCVTYEVTGVGTITHDLRSPCRQSAVDFTRCDAKVYRTLEALVPLVIPTNDNESTNKSPP